jgi:Ca2+-binding RTX toxin-like protein
MFMRGRRSVATVVVASTVGAATSLWFAPSAQSGTTALAVPLSVTALEFVTGPELPGASVGTPYAVELETAGGTGSATFAVTAGALPAGLDLDPGTAEISGTPTVVGTTSFTVTATDADLEVPPAVLDFSITVSETERTCNNLPVTIMGTPGDDILVGTTGDDVFAALSGNDTVIGADGSDSVCGGPGADTQIGGAGDDHLQGHAGEDRVIGGAGDDFLRGGPDADDLVGASGLDDCGGGAGPDRATGCEVLIGVP